MSDVREKFFQTLSPVAQSCSFNVLALLSRDMRDEVSCYSSDDVSCIMDAAENLGLVSQAAMRNSGMFRNGPGMALDHVAKRAQRAFNIVNNPNGYTPPKRPLYGDNNGIPARKP